MNKWKAWEEYKKKIEKKQKKEEQKWKIFNQNEQKQKRRSMIVGGSILGLSIVLNVVSYFFRGFSDWYIAHVFPIWENITGRISSIFPFSLGEWCLYFAIIVVLIGMVLLVMRVIFFYDSSVCHIAKRWWLGIAWICNIVFLLQTLNGFILYRGTSFAETTFIETKKSEETLLALYNHVAEQANTLSLTFPRDEKGFLKVNSENFEETAQNSMLGISHAYPQLSGYYSKVKPIYFSGRMSRQELKGIFLPYTMEANYNSTMYISNQPFALCHELAHMKGFIREDEANFLAYLACVQSSDTFFKYSGYLSTIDYVSLVIKEKYGWTDEVQSRMVKLNEEVQTDNIFLTQEEADRISGTKVSNADNVKKISNKFSEIFLKKGGEESDRYSDVVNLMLYHYQKRESYVD